MSTQANQNSGNFFGLLFLVFLVLKLTGYITWSWWWVTAPLWAGFAFLLVAFVVVAIFTLIVMAFEK